MLIFTKRCLEHVTCRALAHSVFPVVMFRPHEGRTLCPQAADAVGRACPQMDAVGLGSYQKFCPGLCPSQQALAEVPCPLSSFSCRAWRQPAAIFRLQHGCHSLHPGNSFLPWIWIGSGVQPSCRDMHTAHVRAQSFILRLHKDTLGISEVANMGTYRA